MKKFNVIIIGDIMLDRYIVGENSRRSPEADVPIINIDHQFDALGGASNVANNLLALDVNPFLVGVIGNDEAGERVKNLTQKALLPNKLIKDSSRCTTLKTRIVDKHFNQFIRFDQECIDDIESDIETQIIKSIDILISERNIDAIIIQDYNKGIITKKIIAHIQDKCNENKIKLLVDPKKSHFKLLSHCDIFKPNLKEICSFFEVEEKEDVQCQIQTLLSENTFNTGNLFITLADKGIYYKDNEQEGIIKGHKLISADVSGAGDTVISVLTVLLLLKYDIKIMAQIANSCGAAVCNKKGISTINRAELNEIIKKFI